MDYLLAPNASLIVGAIVAIFVLYSISLFIERRSDSVSAIWLLIAILSLYLGWHGGAWLMARFLDTVHSYR